MVEKRPGLTRETMIETGLRLLGEVGLEGLTVRRLAAELGVQSPALYWHIRTKQDLLDGMADAIVVAAGMGPPRDGESWQDWLTRRARAYRTSLLAHRDGARIVANARHLGLTTMRLLDEELTAMAGRGFTPILALRTITALTSYVNGFVLQEQAAGPEPAGASQDRAAEMAGALDPGGVLMAALREAAITCGSDDSHDSSRERAFEHGLRAIVDGTAAALDREAARTA